MTDRGRHVLLTVALTWLTGAMVALVICLSTLFGGRVESYLDPVIDNIQIDAATVTRDSDQICFRWTGDKHRLARLENVDVLLDRPGTGDRTFPDLINRDTGQPWHRNGARPVGEGIARDLCVKLPYDAKADERFDLNIKIWFAGWRSFWLVPVDVPTIPSPRATF
jgi:hypothetical protein